MDQRGEPDEKILNRIVELLPALPHLLPIPHHIFKIPKVSLGWFPENVFRNVFWSVKMTYEKTFSEMHFGV